jgi:hypothetical protein
VCEILCQLHPIILHISDPSRVHPAHVTPSMQGEADKMFASLSPFGLGIDKPTVRLTPERSMQLD